MVLANNLVAYIGNFLLLLLLMSTGGLNLSKCSGLSFYLKSFPQPKTTVGYCIKIQYPVFQNLEVLQCFGAGYA